MQAGFDWMLNRVNAIRADALKKQENTGFERECTVQFSTCEDVIMKEM